MAVEPSRYTTNGQRAPLGNVVSRLVGSKTSPSLPQCQEACLTGAIIRTEFDTVYVQQE